MLARWCRRPAIRTEPQNRLDTENDLKQRKSTRVLQNKFGYEENERFRQLLDVLKDQPRLKNNPVLDNSIIFSQPAKPSIRQRMTHESEEATTDINELGDISEEEGPTGDKFRSSWSAP